MESFYMVVGSAHLHKHRPIFGGGADRAINPGVFNINAKG
jgi:hypothetical protein